MNNLINLIIIWIALFYINFVIKKIYNPILKKFTIMILIIITQYIYEKIKNFFRKKEISNSKIINRGIHRGSLIIVGNSLLIDTLQISLKLPNLINILNTNYGSTTFSLIPFFITIIFKSLLQ